MTPPGQGGIAIQPTPAGRLEGIIHGNGVTTTVTHDDAGRLTAIAHTAGGGTVATASYTLDAHGNRTQETIQQGTQTRITTYGYDSADRLTRLTEPDGETVYTLDGAGNRQTETRTTGGTPAGTKTYTHDARNQLTDIQDTAGPVQTFTYDDAGRQITKTVGAQTWTQAWSAKDRLLTLTLGAGPPQVTYEYDAQGQRTARDADGQRRQYLWDGLTLHAETNAVGNVLASYTHAGRHALTVRNGSDRSHYHTDAQGTPLAITAATGTIEVRYQTDAWGNEQSASASHPNPIGFTGYLKDPATDDLYAQARQYHPATGRFTSRDELRGDPLSPLSLHRFIYGFANPTVYIDPDGRQNIAINAVTLDDEGRISLTAVSGSALMSLQPNQMATEQQAAALNEAQIRSSLFFRGDTSHPNVVGPLLASGAGTFEEPHIHYGMTSMLSAMQQRADVGSTLGIDPSYVPIGEATVTAGAAVFNALPPVAFGNGVNAMANAENGWQFAAGLAEATLGVVPVGLAVRSNMTAARGRLASAQAEANVVVLQGRPMVVIESPGGSAVAFESPQALVQTRVAELRAAIPENIRGRITMAVSVAEDTSGRQAVLVGTSEPRGYLRPGVELRSGERMVPGTGHAEADIVSYATANDMRVVSIGATRPVCQGCQQTIQPTAAEIVTPLKKPRN